MNTPTALIARRQHAVRHAVFEKEYFTPLISSADVGGCYAVWLHEALPGASPPMHVHHREDEVFHVLEGHLLVQCGDVVNDLHAGDTAVLPKGIPHTWLAVGPATAKLIVTVCPGGVEAFFPQMAHAQATHATLSALDDVLHEFGIEIVGPPMDEHVPR
jgi:quercetin dioxygenase-like cupin family protein